MSFSLSDEFKAKARRLRLRAVTVTDPAVQQSYLELAAAYDLDAAHDEAKGTQSDGRKRPFPGGTHPSRLR